MPTRSAAEAIERSTNGSIARTLNRKTSLLRIVPTACGQAADIAAHMTLPRRRFSSPCHAIMLRCSEIAYRSRRYVTIDSRSDPTSSRCQISRAGPPPSGSDRYGIVFRERERWAACWGLSAGLVGSNDPPGGARRDRTDDLLLAKQALSQLSYGPFRNQSSVVSNQNAEGAARAFRLLNTDYRFLELVGLGRFELPTSRLSSARSNQLSYKPGTEISNQ